MSEPIYPCTVCKQTYTHNCKNCQKWLRWFGYQWQNIRLASGKTRRKGDGHG